MTCITSNFDAGTHGDSEGPLVRQGGRIQLQDSIVYAGYGVVANGKTSNECLEIESNVSLAAAAAGESTLVNTIVACEEPAKGTLANGDPLLDWVRGLNPSTNGGNYAFNAGNVVITDSANANVSVLAPLSYFTATAFADATGTAFTMTPASGQVGAVLAERRLDVPVGVRPARVECRRAALDHSVRATMRPSSLGSTVRALLALAAATAAGRGLPAVAQEAPPPPEAAAVNADGLEEIIVEGRQRTAAEQVLQERIELSVVADVVGAEQISRVGDSTVSLALRRLPAVTVVDGQYIYIRGLGERYSSTTLNGAQVPSPDLTRNVIPLDLFPASIVESLKIQKGYSPDKPAAFGGGNVDVRTRSLPDRFIADIQVGTGWNSDSTGRGLTYPGGSDDRWGTDDGTRALPREISSAIEQFTGDITPTGILRALDREGGSNTLADAEQINRDIATNLNRNLDLRKQSLDPDLKVEAALGNMWQVGEGGDWRVGGLAVVDYGDQWRNRERTNRSATSPDVDFDVTERTIRQTTLTGSVAVGLDWAEGAAAAGVVALSAQYRGRGVADHRQQLQFPGERGRGAAQLPDPLRGARARSAAAGRPPPVGRGDARRAGLRARREEPRGPGVRLVLHGCQRRHRHPERGTVLGGRPARPGHR